MATTHALAGFLLGAVALRLGLPGPLVVASAVAGSVAPDLDLYYGHRRTLHYPILYPLATIVVGAVAVVSGGLPLAIAATVFLLGATVHVWTDVLGGGLELRPWEGNSDRAVYDHVRGRWIAPRRLVAYDGSPADLALAGLLTVLAAPFYDGLAELVVFALVGVSMVYVLLRRQLAMLAPTVARRLPEPVRERMPRRYFE